MEGFHFFLFLICGACSASEWALGNQGLSIWLGFCAIGNLVYSVR